MKFQVLNVRYHDFQIINQTNSFVFARCVCCKQSRYAVFKIANSHRFFYYHGYDSEYAQKIFSSLVKRFNSQFQD